jgi:hypothetical protein
MYWVGRTDADAGYEREVCSFEIVWTLADRECVERDHERGEVCRLGASQDRERHVVAARSVHFVSTYVHLGVKLGAHQ